MEKSILEMINFFPYQEFKAKNSPTKSGSCTTTAWRTEGSTTLWKLPPKTTNFFYFGPKKLLLTPLEFFFGSVTFLWPSLSFCLLDGWSVGLS